MAIEATETRIDYDVRTDGQGVYIGMASTGTDVDDPYWTVQKLTYDGSGNVTRVQFLTGSWTGRAALAFT